MLTLRQKACKQRRAVWMVTYKLVDSESIQKNQGEFIVHIATERLQRWQAVSSIASAIAIPVVLATIGYLVQRQIAVDGLKKDYVQIASNILKENPANQEKELRQWAITILDENSPIPFTDRVKSSLVRGSTTFVKLPAPPPLCMKPPAKVEIGGLTRRMKKKLDEGRSPGSLLVDAGAIATDNEALHATDASRLKCLQDFWLELMKDDVNAGKLIGSPS